MRKRGPINVQLLALSGCTSFVPVGMFDLLRKSMELASTTAGLSARSELMLTLVSASRSRTVHGAGGLPLRCDATIGESPPGDVVVVPAIDPDIEVNLKKNAAVAPWIQNAYRGGSDVVSACTGAFLLGEAGLLDGRSATTHWAFQSLLAERYPEVRLVSQAVIVDQGRVVTAGGATSFINLALFLVERLLGEPVARAASRMFLIDPNKAPQGAYAVFSSQKTHGDDAILRAQDLIERDPAATLAIDDVARAVALGRRTFARRFRDATGNTPMEYIHRVRVEAAKRALEHGKSVAEASGIAGYGDPVAFRKIFVRVTGLTPADYRGRYGPKSGPGWTKGGPSRRRTAG